MATYAIGDIQGCLAVAERLLQRCGFNPARDHLWLCGDLVNRGPASLQTLRWARALGDGVTVVLGNHDLLLLACGYGVAQPRPGDTLDAVLRAPDADQLLDWLSKKPLLHVQGHHALVHAGLLPGWSLLEAQRQASAVSACLRDARRAPALLAALMQRCPARIGPPAPDADSMTALLFATRVLTVMRVCDATGNLALDFSGAPKDAPPHFAPWFSWPHGRDARCTVVCGHWSALGLHRALGVRALDTGCVWGRALSALRLEDDWLVQEPAAPKD